MTGPAQANSLPGSAIHRIPEARVRKRQDDSDPRRRSPESDDLAIACLYIAENQELKSQIEALQDQIARTGARADAAEHALERLKRSAGEPSDQDPAEVETAPSAGQTRFYKKTHSKGGYDVLVEVGQCSHGAWQPSAKADKAKKGIERLEGRNNWKSLHHCGTCTGGGMWRVRW